MYKILANTLFLGKQIIYLPTCHSTNDIAAELVSKSATLEGAFVITDDQTKGRGQRGNVWSADPGKNLTLSLILKPAFLSPQRQFYLNMISSLAVQKTVQYFLPNELVQVKWPNDVLVGKSKVAGILIENSLSGAGISSSIFGIGLNVNQQRFEGLNATSIATCLNAEVDKQAVLAYLFLELERLYLLLKKASYSLIKEEYLKNLYGYKTAIKLASETEFVGVIENVEDSGLLVVNKNNNRHRFDFKELRFVIP